jgi:hypothetical protein
MATYYVPLKIPVVLEKRELLAAEYCDHAFGGLYMIVLFVSSMVYASAQIVKMRMENHTDGSGQCMVLRVGAVTLASLYTSEVRLT